MDLYIEFIELRCRWCSEVLYVLKMFDIWVDVNSRMSNPGGEIFPNT